MRKDERPLILVTNDDGFDSPGLHAAVAAAARLGEVLVVAPAHQQTGAGRSLPELGPLVPDARKLAVGGQPIRAYALPGTPALTVAYGVLVVANRPVSLVISGINYGENVSIEVTASGTLGAVLEGAAFGIPSLAVSRMTHKRFFLQPDASVDFSAAQHFTELLGRMLLTKRLPPDVDALNVNVPDSATDKTPWRFARITRQRYFFPLRPEPWDGVSPVHIDYDVRFDKETLERDSEVWAVAVDGVVAVTPISLDLTSRVDLGELARQFAEFGAQ